MAHVLELKNRICGRNAQHIHQNKNDENGVGKQQNDSF